MPTRIPVAAVAAASAGALAAVVDARASASGATAAEIAGPWPGDGIVPQPAWETTRATTISAPPADVWPWIVQMGFPTIRAGWYTPHLLDRLMWGITARSADEIRPGLQHLHPGDRVPDSPDWAAWFTVVEVTPPEALVLRSNLHVLAPYRDIDFTWAFLLAPCDVGTRLVIRARATYVPVWPEWAVRLFFRVVMGPGDLVNTGAMLRGIRRRAERAGARRAAVALPD